MPSSEQLRVSKDHPLTRAITPLSYESPQECDDRLAVEQDAKHVSDAIDEELNRQRISEKKGPKAIKILLLGALYLGPNVQSTFLDAQPSNLFSTEYSELGYILSDNTHFSWVLSIASVACTQQSVQRGSEEVQTFCKFSNCGPSEL
ncbi:hypothetical protein EDD22DRAFT_1006011 [Suillus occidentalis]|nr:hypothetical protein EDD22DRAFT_1006011 [Suillus occidentalis]